MAKRDVLDLRDIVSDARAFEGKTVTLQGWVRNHRKQKNIGFMEFFDGTVLAPMQIVYDGNVQDFAAVQAIRNGAAIAATGVLVAGRGGELEMQAQQITLEGSNKVGLSSDGMVQVEGAQVTEKASAMYKQESGGMFSISGTPVRIG